MSARSAWIALVLLGGMAAPPAAAQECGTPCGEGQYCHEGHCMECTCLGRECGHDGCGAPCGTCPAGQGCDEAGLCVDVDAGCAASEEAGCPGCACEECVCGLDEFCCLDEWDALCARMCQDDCGQACACVPECDGRDCGDDGCGGTCGACGAGEGCSPDGRCESCTCAGRECGDDGCGASCGACGDGEVCDLGRCAPLGCVATATPGCSGCACEECVCLAAPACCGVTWDSTCVDRCDGICGQACPCRPACGGMECGDDGCGGSCGTCGDGLGCVGGRCRECACDGLECGDDGCGGSCGTCPAGEVCADGECRGQYPEACLGLDEPSGPACLPEPGDAGCCDDSRVVWCDGGLLYCLDCAEEGGTACGWGGDEAPFYRCGGAGEDPTGGAPRECACAPACAGRECGDDGCGGSCGACGAGTECEEGRCVATAEDDGPDGGEGGEDVPPAPDPGAPDLGVRESAVGTPDDGADAPVVPPELAGDLGKAGESDGGCGAGAPWAPWPLGLLLGAWAGRRRRS